MNTLRLYIDAGWPELHGDCDWTLLDASGTVLQSGHSEPRHWPGLGEPAQQSAADRAPACELVLSCDQATCLWTPLPKGKAGRNAEVIAYAVESSLLEEPDAYHFVAGPTRENGDTPVIAVARRRLQSLLAALSGIGLTPIWVLVEAQLLPLENSAWSISINHERGCLNTGRGWLCLDNVAADQPPGELTWALQSAVDATPERLIVYCAAQTDCDGPAWARQLGVAVDMRETESFVTPPGHAVNLLQGGFAPPRRHGVVWRSYRNALWLAAALLVLYTLASLGEWGYLSRTTQTLRDEQVALFRATFPDASAIVDPALQMRRNVDAERLRHGMLGDDDFLPLLAKLAALPSVRIGQLHYQGARLQVSLQLLDAHTALQLQHDLSSDGLQLTVRESPAPDRITIDLTRASLP